MVRDRRRRGPSLPCTPHNKRWYAGILPFSVFSRWAGSRWGAVHTLYISWPHEVDPQIRDRTYMYSHRPRGLASSTHRVPMPVQSMILKKDDSVFLLLAGPTSKAQRRSASSHVCISGLHAGERHGERGERRVFQHPQRSKLYKLGPRLKSAHRPKEHRTFEV